MNIFICGGSGYLATCLAFSLSNKYKIFLGTRNPKKIKIKKKNLKIVKVNYFSKKNLIKKFKKINIVINLVGMPKAKSINKKSIKLKKESVLNIIYACKKNKVNKLIYLSSMQVYKQFHKKNIINEYSHINKKNYYSSAHLEAEKILSSKHEIFKDYIIIRAASIFGANVYSLSTELILTLINSFCHQLVTTKKLIISKPQVVRNFLPLSVFINFIDKIIKNKINGNIKIINLGYKTYYLYQIAEILKKRFIKIFRNKPMIILKKYEKNNKKFLFNSIYTNFEFNKKIFLKEIDKTLILFNKIFN